MCSARSAGQCDRALHRGLSDVSAFARAGAEGGREGKPIVRHQVGRSELGAKLAMSHTSSLAGSDKLYDALFERLGIIPCRHAAGAVGDVEIRLRRRAVRRRRLVVFTCSGGDSLMSADRAAGLGCRCLNSRHDAIRRSGFSTAEAFATCLNPLIQTCRILSTIQATTTPSRPHVG